MTKLFVAAEFTTVVEFTCTDAFIAITSKYTRNSAEQIYFQTLN